MRVLLAEDDASLGATLQSWLQCDGYAVDWVRDGALADAALSTHDYQCVLLDRGLPGLEGDAVLRRLRARRATLPVIFITARDTVSDRVLGLDMGADDYLVKPFDLEELSARMRAALRKQAQQASVALQHGDLTLDPVGKIATLAGEPVSLTAREFMVLEALMRNPTHVVARAKIEEALYAWGEEVESNAIEVHVYNLRRKLGGSRIVTVRYQGYRLAAA